MNPSITLISGPPGAGKSTSAKALANAVPKSINIDCDLLYNMVANGYRKPWEDGACGLMNLMYKTAAFQAELYFQNGFTAILNYVFEPDDLEKILTNIQNKDIPLHFAILFPDEGALVSRDAQREHTVGEDRVRNYRAKFSKLKQSLGTYFFDNSGQHLTWQDLAPNQTTVGNLLDLLRG